MECAEDYNLIEPSLKGCFLPTLMTVCCCWGCNTSPTWHTLALPPLTLPVPARGDGNERIGRRAEREAQHVWSLQTHSEMKKARWLDDREVNHRDGEGAGKREVWKWLSGRISVRKARWQQRYLLLGLSAHLHWAHTWWPGTRFFIFLMLFFQNNW